MPRLVVVDVQPHYCLNWPPAGDLMAHLGAHAGNVTMLVNAEGDGLTPDTVDDCRLFWAYHGLEEDLAWSVPVVDKGYGHLRGWMDSGADGETTVAVLKAMIAEGVTDSRDLGEDVIREAAGDGYADWIPDEAMSLGWIDDRTLRSFSGCTLVGGGRNECLLEVELLLRAHGIPYTVDEALTYDGNFGPAMSFR